MKTLSLAAGLAAAVTLTACDTMDNMFNTGNSSTSSNTPTGPMGVGVGYRCYTGIPHPASAVPYRVVAVATLEGGESPAALVATTR